MRTNRAAVIAFVLGIAATASFGQGSSAQLELLNVLGSGLNTCRLAHLTDKQNLRNDLDGYRMLARNRTISQVELVQWSQEAIAKSAANSTNKKCKDETMAAFSETSRKLIAGVSGTALERPSKEALAQWMTTLEATSSDNYDQERSKFNTLSNLVKVELTLK
jgi:hypothetical protein